MKGTLARGRWLEEDESQIQQLKSSAKNRAENIMIVDLLRNDLGKISDLGSVCATELCQVETYETLLQMSVYY
jgi:anthranilate/para-aminobenzoate synthase component I